MESSLQVSTVFPLRTGFARSPVILVKNFPLDITQVTIVLCLRRYFTFCLLDRSEAHLPQFSVVATPAPAGSNVMLSVVFPWYEQGLSR